MPMSGSRLSSPVCEVGADAPAYVGALSAPRYAPGTGGLNPYGYDETSGTGFPVAVGNGMGLLLLFVAVYFCIKKCSKLYRRL